MKLPTEASACSVHCLLGKYSGIRDMVYTNHGVTLQSDVRKPPNVFNLLRQTDVLHKSGGGGTEQQLAVSRLQYS